MRSAGMDFVLEALEPRSEVELYAAFAPFPEFGDDVFGDESDVSRLADEFHGFRVWLGSYESEIGRAIGRADGYPARTGLDAGVEDKVEAKLIEIESEAAVQVTDINGDGLKTKVGIAAVEANRGAVCPFERRARHALIICREEVTAAKCRGDER